MALWPYVSCVNRACWTCCLHALSSEDEDDKVSSGEEDEHNAWNLSLGVVGHSRSGIRVEGFLQDEELARTARSCHLSMYLLSEEMSDAWWSEDCWKVGNDALK